MINAQGSYVGLLTVDMVQEGWQAQDPPDSHSPLAKLLEAKDLLYRSGFKAPTVKVNDRLTATAGTCEDVPCRRFGRRQQSLRPPLCLQRPAWRMTGEVARRSLTLKNQR